MATQAQIKAVQQLYVGYLGRAADSAGLAFWADAIAAGTATIESVATGFTLSSEYKAAYDGLSSGDLVDKVYTNVLGRAADAEGKAYWVDALAKGTVTADTLVSYIVTNLGAVDQATINNKTFVAQTYTDTVGAEYNAEAGANVLVGVDSTPASVTAALAQITNGSLPGQVVGLSLVNTLAAAQVADVAYETANKAALDALATKLNVTVGTDFDAELALVSSAANSARALAANGGNTATEVLAAQVSADQKALTAAFNNLSDAGKTAASAYQAAVVANAALKAAAVTDVAAVEAGLDVATGSATGLAAAELATGETFADSAALYAFYVDAGTTAANRNAIDKAYADASVTYFTTFKATASVDVAKNAAAQAEVTTKAAVATADTTNGAAYNTASDKLVADTTIYTNAQAADVNKTAADALVASNTASEKVVSDAADALAQYNTTHTDTKVIALTGATVAASDTVKETFYFAATPTGSDTTVGTATAHFGAGDAIVLGSGYTFNSGALSTGDNNTLEFFLVSTSTGVQVVLETQKYASAELTASATTGVAAAADNATVITLTGVTAADLTVNNGVISHVA